MVLQYASFIMSCYMLQFVKMFVNVHECAKMCVNVRESAAMCANVRLRPQCVPLRGRSEVRSRICRFQSSRSCHSLQS